VRTRLSRAGWGYATAKEADVPAPVRVIGLGGSLRSESTSLTALQTGLEGARAAQAETRLLGIRELNLPMYTPEQAVPPAAREYAEDVYSSDALIWSSPTYHGSVSGSFKNALDWLILLAENDPAYLTNKPVGLVTTAGGVQGLQSVNSMDFIVRALRGWSVPMVLPVAQSWQTFDPDGRLVDDSVRDQLHELGAEVVRAARQFQASGTCDYADSAQFSPDGRPEPAGAGAHR
jgi:FMN reductase